MKMWPRNTRPRRGGPRAPCLALGLLLAVSVGPAAAQGAMSMSMSTPDPERIAARLADPGTRAEAGAELLLWIRELSPERASHWLHLAVAMDRLPPDQVGAAALAVLRSDPAVEPTADGRLEAARNFRDETLAHPPADQPVLVALAAHLLEPDAPDEALALRRRYLAAGFDGPDAAEVVIAVARALLGESALAGGSPGAPDEAPAVEALRILEHFLEGAPDHPMAPEARRLRTLALQIGDQVP